MDPLEFLVLANSLAKVKEPASIRTAISRAYYCAFHISKGFLSEISVSLISKGKQEHGEVSALFGYSEDKELQKVGVRLANLAETRRKADYELEHGGSEKESTATEALNDAGTIRVALDTCKGSTSRCGEVSKVLNGYQARRRG